MCVCIDAYEFSNCGQFYLPPDASPPRCAQTWFSPGAPPKPDNDNKETAVSQCNSGVQRQHGFLATRRPSLSPCPYKGASHAGDTMGNAGDPLWRGAATAASPDPKFFPATVVRPRASKLKQTPYAIQNPIFSQNAKWIYQKNKLSFSSWTNYSRTRGIARIAMALGLRGWLFLRWRLWRLCGLGYCGLDGRLIIGDALGDFGLLLRLLLVPVLLASPRQNPGGLGGFTI